MITDLSSLIKDTEALPESPVKKEALSALLALQKDSEDLKKYRAEQSASERSQTMKRRIVGIFLSLPLACVPLYFALTGVLTGRSPITFHRGIKHIYWRDDPYYFSFVIGFVALIGLVMLYLALYPIITGKEPSGKLVPQTRRSKDQSASWLPPLKEHFSSTFQPTRGGRVRYLVWTFVFGGIGVFMLSGLFSEQAQSQNHGWPVFAFSSLVLALWLGFAGYCGLRAFKSAARVVVDTNGFSYDGVLKATKFSWKDITSTRWIFDRGGFEWLEITIKRSDQKPRRLKLDFSGLSPNRSTFINHVRTLAPWAEIK